MKKGALVSLAIFFLLGAVSLMSGCMGCDPEQDADRYDNLHEVFEKMRQEEYEREHKEGETHEEYKKRRDEEIRCRGEKFKEYLEDHEKGEDFDEYCERKRQEEENKCQEEEAEEQEKDESEECSADDSTDTSSDCAEGTKDKCDKASRRSQEHLCDRDDLQERRSLDKRPTGPIDRSSGPPCGGE